MNTYMMKKLFLLTVFFSRGKSAGCRKRDKPSVDKRWHYVDQKEAM